jgi:hypothetical protein
VERCSLLMCRVLAMGLAVSDWAIGILCQLQLVQSAAFFEYG